MSCPICLRIAGNGASEKNLKDGVCAQFEKNFAKAKWRVCIHFSSVDVRLNEGGSNSRRDIERAAEEFWRRNQMKVRVVMCI